MRALFGGLHAMAGLSRRVLRFPGARGIAGTAACVALLGLAACGGGGGGGSAGEELAAQDPVPKGNPFTAPLVQQSDLTYEGAFRVPQGGSETSTFEYGGTALGFNPARNSLFMTGHDWHQLSAEMSIPALVNSASLSSLNVASLLQPFADPTEGRRNAINPGDSNGQKVGGHLVYGGKLYVGAYSYYDAGYSQSASHFARPVSLSTTGQVQGPLRVGTGSLSPRWVGGYMGTIPPEWQSALGGPALTGIAGIPIASAGSVGPAASVFDPAKLGAVNPAPATLLLGYALDQSLPSRMGYSMEGGTNPVWNLTSEVRGVVFPEGTRSVLFFGRHGIGTYCYGEGAQCNDPADADKGTHAYPYVYQVWAYDANELLAVKEGRKQAHELLPYAIWTFNLPFENNGKHLIGGAAWDPATRRIYIAQRDADGPAPVIHAFRVSRP